MALSLRQQAKRRSERTRRRLKAVANGRLRLSVYRSDKNISAQIIDDAQGVTVVAASSLEGGKGKKGSDIAAASAIGKLIAERAIEKGVKDVVFDRGEYIYHGRVKALAEAAREAGAVVVGVATVVDRATGADQVITKLGVPYRSLLGLADIGLA